MKQIFITGESGTIPLAMQQIAPRYGYLVANTQLEDNDLTSFKKHQSFKVRKPEIDFLDRDLLFNSLSDLWENIGLIIHSGAFVGTDYCLSDPSLAIRTNVEGTQNIVDICNKYEIPLIYFSTTAIMDPKNYNESHPITEHSRINPQTLYGITKYAGELIVQNCCITNRMILRPVFGFGNYPEDLHSALTKLIYVVYRNLQGSLTNLNILLDMQINKSYTRVENIATCVLELSRQIYQNPISYFNIGEHHSRSENWYSLISRISSLFQSKDLCSSEQFDDIMNNITFIPQADYLHYHNIDDERLQRNCVDFKSFEDYINLSKGIEMTIDSVIKNINQEPYWL